MHNKAIVAFLQGSSLVDLDGAENSSIVFSTCGNDCIDNAAWNSNCDSNDNLRCLCQDLNAQIKAMSCLNKSCSFKDIDTFEDAMDNCPDPDPKGIESTTTRTTFTSTPPTSSGVSMASHTAPPTTTTSQPEVSITPSSSPKPPPDTTSVDVGQSEDGTASPSSGIRPSPSSVSFPSSATSAPLLTSALSESHHLPSSASASENTPAHTSTGTSSLSSADSSTPSPSSATSPSISTTASADTHGPSRTAIISLSAALAVLFLIGLLISVFYLLRRRHRRTKRLKPSLPQTGSATKEEAHPPPTSEAKHADTNSDHTSVQNGPTGVTRASECVDARIAVTSPPRTPELAPPASGLFRQAGSAHAEGVPLAQTGSALHALPTSQSVPLAQNAETVRFATDVNATASTGMGDASFTAGDVGSAGETRPAALPALPEAPAKAHVDDSEMHCPPSCPDAGISAEPTLVSPSPPSALAPSETAAASPGVSRMRRQRFLTVVMDLSEEDAEAGHPPPYYPRISNEAGAVHASEGEAHCA